MGWQPNELRCSERGDHAPVEIESCGRRVARSLRRQVTMTFGHFSGARILTLHSQNQCCYVTPDIIAFAAVFFIAAYGLHRRTVWYWWGGWLVFFLAAGYYGTYTYSALYYAETP